MAVTFFPFNSIVVDGVPDRPANAENLAAYLAGFFSNGVIMQEDTALKVEAYSGMSVQIRAGMGNINGKTILADAAEIITLDTASTSMNRIDRVVFRLDEAKRLMEFDVLRGTPASSPVAPALTQTAAIYELCLAEIRVPAGATSIAESYITDTRSNPTVCGASQIPDHGHRDLLWINASPASTFAEQTISLDLSEYDGIEIIFDFTISTAYGVHNSVYIPIGKNGLILGAYTGYLGRRRLQVMDNGVIFESGGYYKSYGSSTITEQNEMVIPIEIHGIKGVQ